MAPIKTSLKHSLAVAFALTGVSALSAQNVSNDTLFHDNGKIKSITPYLENNQIHGVVRLYDNEGNLNHTEMWKEGKLHGRFVDYDAFINIDADGKHTTAIEESEFYFWEGSPVTKAEFRDKHAAEKIRKKQLKSINLEHK